MKQFNINATGTSGYGFTVPSHCTELSFVVTDTWGGAATGAWGSTTLTLEYEAPDGKWIQVPGISLTANNGAQVPVQRSKDGTNYQFRSTGGSGIDLQATVSFN